MLTRPQRKHGPKAEMNVVPYIDVMLVLLVIFIITAPLLTSSLKLELPRSEAAASSDAPSFVALALDSEEKVQALHAKALALGAQDEGTPGPRGGGSYAAYFRDLDGNKLNAFCVKAA